jgi:MFS family permease
MSSPTSDPIERPRRQRVWHAIASGGAALRHRNFRLFFIGQLISLVGTWMQSLAQQWLVFTLTHSALQLGIVGAFQYTPVLLVSLFAGVLVDRLPKRALIVATQVLFLLDAAVLGVLVVSGSERIWEVDLIAAIYGTINAFDIPARQAFMVEMVGRDDLLNGIALNSSIFNASRIFGPAIAAELIQVVGTGVCFLINAASYLAVIAGLLMMTIDRAPKSRAALSHPLGQIKDGLSYITHTERVWLVFAVVAAGTIFGVPMYTTLLPIVATSVLHSGVSALGNLSVALGVGAMIGALLLAYLPPGPIRARLLLGASLAFGTLIMVFGLSHVQATSVLLMTGIGFSVVSVNSSGNAIIQEVTPHHLRGRVMSVWGIVIVGMTPIGSVIAGALAQRFGAPSAIVLGGIFCLVIAAFVNVRARRHDVMSVMPQSQVEAALLD